MPQVPAGYTEESFGHIYSRYPRVADVLKSGQLNKQQMDKFADDGFVVIENFFSDAELEPIKKAISDLVETAAQKLYKGGKIKSLYEEYGFYERMTMIEKEFPGANIIVHKLKRLPTEFCNLWENERLLNLAEQILESSDISGHPVWNLRIKTPKSEATNVPWHQDCAYLDNSAYKTYTLTAWIPLLDTNAENGCLQVLKGGQKPGRVCLHQCCHGGTWYVMTDEQEMAKTLGADMEKDIVTVPVPYGGLIIFNNFLPHQSLNNVSKQIRWSLDLRWIKTGEEAGFYGLKQPVKMRSSTDPHMKIDWDTFNTVDRHTAAIKCLNDKEEDEFDTTIVGPWMTKWEVVHHNRHTASLTRNDQAYNDTTAFVTG